MSKLNVKIIAHTLNPEETIACAGKLCYSKVGVNQIAEKQSEEDIDRFVNMLSSIGHESPLEHASFTFAVEGISRACSHQLVRHRMASYSQQSQRYVDLKNTYEYITPPVISENNYINEIYNKAMEQAFENYVKLSEEILLSKIYDYLVEKDEICNPDSKFMKDYMIQNHKKKYNSFVKESIEDARYVLPNACETKIVFTMNGRSLLNFLKHRECRRAQWEIRELASEMRKQLIEIAPSLFSRSGAECRRGKCPEGHMSCGQPYPKM